MELKELNLKIRKELREIIKQYKEGLAKINKEAEGLKKKIIENALRERETILRKAEEVGRMKYRQLLREYEGKSI